MSRSLFSLIDCAIGQIFLPSCIYCQKSAKDGPFCEDCSIPFPLKPPFCHRCGEPLPQEMKSCGFCLKREYQAIDHVTSLAWLTSPYHKLLLLIKYSGQSHFFSYLFRVLNPLLTQSVLSPKESPTAVPVPISLRRWLSRSFNQSEFFAMWFADTYQLAYSADFLRKDSRAKPQSSLNEKQRKTELSGHFSCRKNCPIPDSVLLIDDIFTTGYTLDYAARCLKNEGVKKVSAMTLFRTPLRGADI